MAEPIPDSATPDGESRTLTMLGNSLTLIAGKLATMGLGFLAWIVAARIFDRDVVGIGSADISAMMLCVQFSLLGTGAAIITLLPQMRSHPGKLINTSFTMATGTSLLAGGAYLLIAWLFFDNLSSVATNPVDASAFMVMTVTGTLGVVLDQLSTALRRGDQVLVRGAASGIATVALVGLLPIWLDDQTGTLLLAWAGGNLVPVLIGWVQVHRSIPGLRLRPLLDRDVFRKINRVGIPNWVLTLTERAPGALLPLVVAEVLTPQKNAAWYAAWMMAWVIYVVPIQVGLNLFAETSRNPETTHHALQQGVLTSLAIGTAAALVAAFLGPLMLSFLGSGYDQDGSRPLQILLIGVIPFTFIQAYFAICRSTVRMREAIATGLVSAVVGVSLAAVAASRYGLDGMALTWVLVLTVIAVWSVYRLRGLGYLTNARSLLPHRPRAQVPQSPIVR